MIQNASPATEPIGDDIDFCASLDEEESALSSRRAGELPRVFLPRGRRVGASHGVMWIREGYRLYRSSAGTWFVLTLIIVPFALLIAGGLHRGLDGLPVFGPILTCGIMLGLAEASRGGRFRIAHLVPGAGQWGRGVFTLVTAGAVWSVVSSALFSVFDVGRLMDSAPQTGFRTELLPYVLIATALGIVVWMANLFARALVALHGFSGVEALRRSFSVATRSFGAIAVYYALLALGSVVLLLVTCGLGAFVVVPVFFTSAYAAYRDLFFEPAS